jgi:hypothetical protein
MKTPFLVLGILFLQLNAFASLETKQAKIEELLQLLGARETLEVARVQNVESVRVQVASGKGPFTDDAATKRFHARVMEKYDALMKELMAWDRYKPFYSAFYDSIFTEAQIDDLLAFFKSNTGQTYIRAIPGLTIEIQKKSI